MERHRTNLPADVRSGVSADADMCGDGREGDPAVLPAALSQADAHDSLWRGGKTGVRRPGTLWREVAQVLSVREQAGGGAQRGAGDTGVSRTEDGLAAGDRGRQCLPPGVCAGIEGND